MGYVYAVVSRLHNPKGTHLKMPITLISCDKTRAIPEVMNMLIYQGETLSEMLKTSGGKLKFPSQFQMLLAIHMDNDEPKHHPELLAWAEQKGPVTSRSWSVHFTKAHTHSG